MSLLDDARKMLDAGPLDDGASGEYHQRCIYCGVQPRGERRGPFRETPAPHEPNCPWLSMPKIVAVLEAVEAVARAYDQETVGSWGYNLGSPLLAAVDVLDKALGG